MTLAMTCMHVTQRKRKCVCVCGFWSENKELGELQEQRRKYRFPFSLCSMEEKKTLLKQASKTMCSCTNRALAATTETVASATDCTNSRCAAVAFKLNNNRKSNKQQEETTITAFSSKKYISKALLSSGQQDLESSIASWRERELSSLHTVIDGGSECRSDEAAAAQHQHLRLSSQRYTLSTHMLAFSPYELDITCIA